MAQLTKHKWLIAIAAAVVIVLAVIWIALAQASKPDRVLEKFENAVKTKDTKQLEGLIVADNPNALVNNTSLQAMIRYLKTNANSYQVIRDGIHNQIKDENYAETNQQISLVQDGKKWGFFPDYKLKVKTVHLKVTGQSDNDQLNVSIGNMKVPEKKESHIYGPLLPGTYQTNVTVKNSLGTFFQKEKKDLWGNSEVSMIVDDSRLAQKSENVQKGILEAVRKFNEDLSVYTTSGLDANKLSNATDSFKEDFSLEQAQFEAIKDYVNEVTSQYLGSVVNMDELSINHFDSDWKAEIEALVSYNEKVKYTGEKNYEDYSYKTLRKYTLKYDKNSKKWLVDDAADAKADGSESSAWENKKELKQKNAPVLKWVRSGDKSDI